MTVERLGNCADEREVNCIVYGSRQVPVRRSIFQAEPEQQLAGRVVDSHHHASSTAEGVTLSQTVDSS